MGRKLCRIQACKFGPLFDDIIDRFRVDRPFGNIAPTVDFPKYAAGRNACYRLLRIQRVNRSRHR